MSEQSIQHCMELVREHDYGRYLACLYLPPDVRDAAFAIYAFDGEISRISTLVSEPMPGEIRLQWWRDVVSGKSDAQGNPVAEALVATIKLYSLPVMIFERLLDAHIFDLYHDPMPDLVSFEGYLGETKSALFHLMTMVMLTQDEQDRHEEAISNACGHSGVFAGSIGLLKLLGDHHHSKRQFFPNEISQHQPILIESTDNTRLNDKWLKDVCVRTSDHANKANLNIWKLPEHCRSLFLPLVVANLDFGLIAKNGIDFSTRYQSPSRLRIWWRIYTAVKSGDILPTG